MSLLTHYVNVWIAADSRRPFYAKVRCEHHHPTIEDALRCGDAPAGAFVRRVDCGIERSMTDEDMAEVRRYFKGPTGKKLQAA